MARKIQIVIIINEKKLSGRLTKFWTGCYAYHAAFVDLDNDRMYDMNLLRRRRIWSEYAAKKEYFLFDAPGNVTREYLEGMLDTDENRYGVFDYMLFAIRPLYHLFGYNTRNAGGVICSEMVNNDVLACGGSTPWRAVSQPPSPCDWYRFLMNETLRIHGLTNT
jgi:hypothetical protein